MKQFLALCAAGVCAGAVCGWGYALTRTSLAVSEATISVSGAPGGSAGARRMLLERPLLAEAARQAGGALAGLREGALSARVYARVVDANRLTIGCRAADESSGEAFIRSWIASLQAEIARRASEGSRGSASHLRAQLAGEEQALTRAEGPLRSFLKDRGGLSGEQADRLVAQLAQGGGAINALRAETADLEKEMEESERQARKLSAKEQSLEDALAREEKQIVTYQVKEENPVVRELNHQLNEKQMKLQQLRIDSTEKHPMRARLEQEIMRIKELLKDKPPESIKEQRREINPVYNDISLELSRTRREMETLRNNCALLRESKGAAQKRAALLGSEMEKQGSPIADYCTKGASARALRSSLEETDAKIAAGMVPASVTIVELASSSGRHGGRAGFVAVGGSAGAIAGVLLCLLFGFRRRGRSL